MFATIAGRPVHGIDEGFLTEFDAGDEDVTAASTSVVIVACAQTPFA